MPELFGFFIILGRGVFSKREMDLGGVDRMGLGRLKTGGPPKFCPPFLLCVTAATRFLPPPGIKNGWNYATRAEGSAAASRDSGNGGIRAGFGVSPASPQIPDCPLPEGFIGAFPAPAPQGLKMVGITQ